MRGLGRVCAAARVLPFLVEMEVLVTKIDTGQGRERCNLWKSC